MGSPKRRLHDLEAEQAVIGAMLFDNAAYGHASGILRKHHFYEPLHQRLFAAMEECIRREELAEPIMLVERFRGDPAFEEAGGLRYLADLVDRAPPAEHTAKYAQLIHDLALRRELVRIGEGIAISAADRADSPAQELIGQAEKELHALGESEQESPKGFVSFVEALRSAVEVAAEAYCRDDGVAGISTGISELDKSLGGIFPSDFVVLASSTVAGHASLATDIAFHVASKHAQLSPSQSTGDSSKGEVVALFSLETSAEQVAMQLLANVASISVENLRSGEINAAEFGRVRDAALTVQDTSLFIDDTYGLGVFQLIQRAMRLKRRTGLSMVVIDELLMLRWNDDYGRTEQPLARILDALIAFASQEGIPVVGTSRYFDELIGVPRHGSDHALPLGQVRHLEDGLNVIAFRRAAESAREEGTLPHWNANLDGKRVKLKEIVDQVSEYTGVSHSRIISAERSRDVSHSRQLCMYLARNMTALSLVEIGKFFGGRDPATVLHSIRRIERGISANTWNVSEIEELAGAIRGLTTHPQPTERTLVD